MTNEINKIQFLKGLKHFRKSHSLQCINWDQLNFELKDELTICINAGYTN